MSQPVSYHSHLRCVYNSILVIRRSSKKSLPYPICLEGVPPATPTPWNAALRRLPSSASLVTSLPGFPIGFSPCPRTDVTKRPRAMFFTLLSSRFCISFFVTCEHLLLPGSQARNSTCFGGDRAVWLRMLRWMSDGLLASGRYCCTGRLLNA